MQSASMHGAPQQANPKTQKKKTSRHEWFKRGISGLIAIVTILGAWVAWRAQVAGNDSGDLDSKGILALQNDQETISLAYIEANSHEIAYTDYLRNRTIAKGMVTDGTLDNPNDSLADQERIARTVTETLDVANTSKFFFFPGRYLDQNDAYDFDREVNEIYAKAEQEKDLDFQSHFDRSDVLSNKVMGLISMLIVLAMSVWLLAIAEVLSNGVKYATALGGIAYMILGGVSAYLIDSDSATPAAAGDFVWTASWIIAGITLLLSLLFGALALINRKPKAAHGGPPSPPAGQYVPPPAPTPTPAPPPMYPPAGYAAPTPPAGYPNPTPPAGYPAGPTPSAGYGGPVPPAGYGGPVPPAGYGGPVPPAGYMGPVQPQPPPGPAGVPTPVYMPPEASPMQGAYTSATAQMTAAPVAVVEAVEEEEEADEEEEPFKKIVTVLIATVALIAAIVAYLQSDASNQAGSANRNVQQFSLQALGDRTYGASEIGYHYYTAAHNWKQLDVLARSADNHNDPLAAARYRAAMDAISARTDIFDSQYFNSDTDTVPDQYAYASDLYVTDATNLSERSVIQLGVHGEWDAKASAYIAHLTLLAVALALFGLALATSSFVRYVFVSAGGLIVIATIIWAVGVYAQPVKSISDDAVDAYAQGVGHNEAGRYQDAIDSLNKALSIEPGYANALYERGTASINQYYSSYSANYFANVAGNTDEANQDAQNADEQLQKAIDDYEAARKAGKDDVNTDWGIGWAYYLQGNFDKALEADQRALDKDPSIIGVRMNKAVTLLVQGKYSDAEFEYNTAIAKTNDQIQEALDKGKTLSSNFWYYINAGVGDLFNVALRGEDINFYFTEAPPKDKIADLTQTEDEAFNFIVKLRNKIAEFEYLATYGTMPTIVTTDATVKPFEFGAVVAGESEEQKGIVFPNNVTGINTYYSYENIPTGSTVSFKVYINFQLYPEYTYTVDDWQNPESDDRIITVTDPYDQYSEAYYLAPGLYTIEMYVDNQYVQSGICYVQTQTETESTEP